MEFLVFFFFLGLFLMILSNSQFKTKKACWELKKQHAWIDKKVGENEYKVCKECGMLPGGDFEEKQ